MSVNKLRQYFFPYVISILGYMYLVFRIWNKLEQYKIYQSTGADETTEAYTHSFVSLTIATCYLIVLAITIILAIVEYKIVKKHNTNKFYKNKFQTIFNNILNIIFWTGIVLAPMPLYTFFLILLGNLF